jgi:acetoin utilization deacetylase AcuC-like enzyme
MQKYARLRERVANQLTPAVRLHVPEAAEAQEILRAHTPDYVERVLTGTMSRDEVRRMGFPWSPELVERSRRSSGGTTGACRSALDEGIAVNLAGGTHHAFADRAEGYCVFNDSVIAARAMQAEGKVRRVVILDCDVHQGNGTAAICREDSRFTLSRYMASGISPSAKKCPISISHYLIRQWTSNISALSAAG